MTALVLPNDFSGAEVPLGKIEVGALLGQGGFGVVHAARVHGIDQPLAIKFLNPMPFNAGALETARDRFKREATLLFKLRHPHIVAIYGVGEYAGTHYILTERFPGMNLQQARGAVAAPDPQRVLVFIERVADALAYAHSKGVVHRDIKPTNLMAAKDDARVLDFGVAGLLDPDGTRFTRTGGTFVGDAFSAPELQENPRLCEPPCDVFSLGATWFWLLTGKTPKGVSWEAALRGAVKVEPDYERVVLKCLAQSNSRYQSMIELLSEVRALRAGVKPKASVEVLSDDDVLVLGVIANACASPGESTTFYQVEQELKGKIDRFMMGTANRRLLRMDLIKTFEAKDWDDGHFYSAVALTAAGEMWTDSNHVQVATALQRLKPDPASPAPEDDIPF